MSLQDPREPETERLWKLLDTVEHHPTVEGWLGELDAEAERTRAAGLRKRFRVRAYRALAASVLLAVGAGLGFWLFTSSHYETLVGEQRDVILPDGSRMTLNTNTALTVRYSNSRRYIDLERGEALFSVQRDAKRPFSVAAGGTLTRALGTEFNVDVRRAQITVSVIEGAVQVAATGSLAREVPATLAPALSKGEAVEIRPRERRVIAQKADLNRIDAWRDRRLEFTDTPLPEAVDEFNRYSRQQVVIGTAALRSVRVSGVFRIGDAEGFLFSLRESLGVQALESGGEVILTRTR